MRLGTAGWSVLRPNWGPRLCHSHLMICAEVRGRTVTASELAVATAAAKGRPPGEARRARRLAAEGEWPADSKVGNFQSSSDCPTSEASLTFIGPNGKW